MPAGRPPFYETPESMEEGINAYFEYIKGAFKDNEMVNPDGSITKEREIIRYPEPATITGLALHLGFTDRQSLYDYQEKEQFTCIVKKARTIIECEYEKRLAGQSPTGAIFALKNMGWKDKSEVEQSGGLFINWHEEKTYNKPEKPEFPKDREG